MANGTNNTRGSSKLTSSEDSGIINVKAFDDLPKNGFEFEGDGQATVDFFNENSNYDELINQMDYDEKFAFNYYSQGHFMSGQIYEDGFAGLSKEDKKYVRIYDKFLDQAYLDKGIEVRRRSDAQLLFGKGKTHATLEELQALEGTSIISRGNLSTSAAKEGLLIAAGKTWTETKHKEKPIEYIMKIPGKTKGAGMWIGDDRINGWGNKQREFMTNRDIGFKVGKTKYNKEREVYEVELRYLGKMDHDYGGE